VERKSLRTLDGRTERRGRIARSVREELHASPLDRRFGPESPVRISVSLGIAVIAGIGEDQDTFGPALLGLVDLQTAEDLAVSDQEDLVLSVDTKLSGRGIVAGAAVIHVDYLAPSRAGRAVAVERAERIAARRVLVGGDGCLIRRQFLLGGPSQLQIGRR